MITADRNHLLLSCKMFTIDMKNANFQGTVAKWCPTALSEAGSLATLDSVMADDRSMIMIDLIGS